MNDDLLVKYLAGEADDRERAQVHRWLVDEENAKEYDRLERIWLESGQLPGDRPLDEHAAWERFRTRIHSQKQIGRRPESAPRRVAWLPAAAVFALLVTAGWLAWILLQQYNQAIVEVASGQEVKVVELSDGSVVTLNKASRVSYVRQFQEAQRLVSLEGEAFFDVARDTKRPFIIYVNDVRVEVTGTSFNIKDRDGLTEVIVESGSVEVSRAGREIALKAGEKTVSNSSGNLVKQQTRNLLYQYYRTNQFVCRGTPLQELVDALNEAYQTRIRVPDPALQQLPITTVFDNESLDDILNVIGDTFDITIHHEEKQILLKR